MCGQLSMIGAVAVIVMIGALLIPASTSGALLTPALPFAVPSFGVSLARISGLGVRRFITVVTIGIVRLPQGRADDALTAMDKLLFWLGIGAAQKGWIEQAHG